MLIVLNRKLTKFGLVKHFCQHKMTSQKCTVAVGQFTATNSKNNNLKIVSELVEEAARKKAKIVFLPEACDYIGTSKDETKALAEPLSGTLMTQYKTLAKSHQIWLSIGGFHELVKSENNDPKFYNCHVLIDDKGEIKSTYRKVHLFDVSIPESNVFLKESDMTQPGYEVVSPVDTPAGSLSLSICYDLRFPELSLLQRKQGADILTFPSAFTYATGLLHWEILLRARAIETQCFIIAAAQYGKHNEKRVSWGQALIVDPRGTIVAECPKFREGHETNQSLAVAEIDLDLVKKIRREMPTFQHRRDDLYQLKMVNSEKSFPLEDSENLMFADKIIPGSTVFYRTKYSFAFTNIRCVVPGHVLVASLRVARRLEDLEQEEIADLFTTVVKVQKILENVHSAHSTTICVQDGKEAGQTVPHVHVHILPRHTGDFQRNDDIYERLAKHDRDSNPDSLRSINEMSEEARKLRA